MKPMPRMFERLFNVIVLAFIKYVDIMKPMELIVAHVTTRVKAVQKADGAVRALQYAAMTPKTIRAGTEIIREAIAAPRA